MRFVGGRDEGRADAPSGVAAPVVSLEARIADFWAWWTQVRDGITASWQAGRIADCVSILTEGVGRIDPGLVWEIAPGADGSAYFVVSAGGDPRLRRAARLWLRGAPVLDPIWSFTDFKQPVDVARTRAGLMLEGAPVLFEDIRAVWRRVDNRLDVRLAHPDLARLSDDAQASLAFAGLDAILGEEAVELWLREVLVVPAGLEDGRPPAELAQAVTRLRDEVRPGGVLGWTVLAGDTPRGPISASAQECLTAVTAPDLDHHVQVTLPYRDRTADGFPGPASQMALEGFEDGLVEDLGVTGRLVAVETCAGERTLHFYVDPASDAAQHASRAAAEQWVQGQARVQVGHDPAWEGVAHLRT